MIATIQEGCCMHIFSNRSLFSFIFFKFNWEEGGTKKPLIHRLSVEAACYDTFLGDI